MRRLLLSMIGAGVLIFPAMAQAQAPQHGIYTGNLIFTYTGEVLPGQEQAFKEMVPKIVAAVAQEPGTMAYEWSMRGDGKTFDVVDIYQDSNAVVAHVKDVVAKFGGELGKTQKTVKFVVYGNPDAEARKAIEGLHPEYETPIGGFVR